MIHVQIYFIRILRRVPSSILERLITFCRYKKPPFLKNSYTKIIVDVSETWCLVNEYRIFPNKDTAYVILTNKTIPNKLPEYFRN